MVSNLLSRLALLAVGIHAPADSPTGEALAGFAGDIITQNKTRTFTKPSLLVWKLDLPECPTLPWLAGRLKRRALARGLA